MSAVQRQAESKASETAPKAQTTRRDTASSEVSAAAWSARTTVLLPTQAPAAPLAISTPGDAAEHEAETLAQKVVSMPPPAAGPRLSRSPMVAARAPTAAPASGDQTRTSAETAMAIKAELSGGAPLPKGVQDFMTPRFRADFSNVRIHTDAKAENLASRLGAKAFTYGNHVFFNRGQFQPETSTGKELIAHELAHTIQQSAAVQRQVDTTVSQRAQPQVQRGVISEALDWFADKANYIPGFRLITIVIGINPINMSRVDRSAANILRALVEFLPGGGLIVEALDRYGIFDKAGSWIESQIASLGIGLGSIKAALDAFVGGLGVSDIFHLGSVWERAKRIFTEPIDRLIAFARSLVSAVLDLIKDAILKPLAALAARTPGWDLLKAVLGRDPITGEAVPRNADTLIGGFMKLIGQEEIWENIKKANAIPRAWAWFQTALSGLMGLVSSIPERFMSTLRSLVIMDLVLPPRALLKVAGAFASFMGDFLSWAGGTVMDLLKIIMEVVAPNVMPYVRKAQGAFNTIIRNPIGFVGNLVNAGKLGFRNFASNFLTHLRASLVGWLTGAMAGAAIYIPQGFSLREILKFALSVLGLTWANIRAKLVAATNETVVKALETGFDIVVTLVREGPAAAWQKILETLGNLRDMVIEQVMTFVKDRIVSAAVTKLLSMLSPAGAFIQAIIAIYNTVMFFVERLRQIAAVAASFIDAIAAIASGNIGPAAARVESTLAGLLTLVISFLARIAGLGKVSDAVVNIINRIRAPINSAIDRVVAWVVAQARRLGKMAAEGAAAVIDWWREKQPFTNKDGESHTIMFIGTGPTARLGVASIPNPVETYLDAYDDKDSADYKTARSVFAAAKQVIFTPAARNEAERERRAKVKGELAKVSAAFARLAGDPPAAADYGTNSKPSNGEIDIAHTNPMTGTITGGWPRTQPGYKEIYDAGLTTATDKWVQMHVVSEKLGGSGTDPSNLVPAPQSVNLGPFRSFEHSTASLIKAKSGKIKNRVWVKVTVGKSGPYATSISGTAGLYFWKGKKAAPNWMKNSAPSFTANAGIPLPQLTANRKLVINFTSGTEMTRDFGLSSTAATLVKQGRPYGDVASFRSSMITRGATVGQVNAVLSREYVLNGP